MDEATAKARVGIVCGSRSDFPIMEKAVELLRRHATRVRSLLDRMHPELEPREVLRIEAPVAAVVDLAVARNEARITRAPRFQVRRDPKCFRIVTICGDSRGLCGD